MSGTIGEDGTSDRREVIRRMGLGAVGAGLVWTTPMIMSAPASASASAPPPVCPGCGLEGVVNGSFEGGSTGWSGNIGTSTYDYLIQATALTGPPSGPGVVPGSNLGVMNAGSTAQQTITVASECIGNPYTFEVWAIGLQGPGSIEVDFIGSNGTTDILIDVPVNTFPATMQQFTRAGLIPPGTTAVTIKAISGVEINKLFVDLVSFVIGCAE